MKVMKMRVRVVDHSLPTLHSKVTNDPIAGKVDTGVSYEPVESKDSDEDDALSYFQKLAEE